VVYHDFDDTGGAPDVQAVAAYIEPRKSGIDVVRVVGYRMVLHDGQLTIGGAEHGTFFKNAAIGRRSCPCCWDPDDPARIKSRGASVGLCPRCGADVDPLLTALRPYFYYYHFEDGDDSNETISGRSDLVPIADRLKTALLTEPKLTGLRLPTVTDHNSIELQTDCVMLFPRGQQGGLIGKQGCVAYDFWHHSMRQVRRDSSRKHKRKVMHRE
jgi:hypothetical protein